MIFGQRSSTIIIILSNQISTVTRDASGKAIEKIKDEYYYCYIDQYLIESKSEELMDDIFFNNDITDGEKIEFLLDGPMDDEEFSFDHVRRIDDLQNNKPLIYVNEYDSITYFDETY